MKIINGTCLADIDNAIGSTCCTWHFLLGCSLYMFVILVILYSQRYVRQIVPKYLNKINNIRKSYLKASAPTIDFSMESISFVSENVAQFSIHSKKHEKSTGKKYTPDLHSTIKSMPALPTYRNVILSIENAEKLTRSSGDANSQEQQIRISPVYPTVLESSVITKRKENIHGNAPTVPSKISMDVSPTVEIDRADDGVNYMDSVLGQIILFTDLVIGKGKFGTVYEGMLNGNTVAVKMSTSSVKSSWEKETDIYSMTKLRHPGILNFFGSDVVSDKLLLITEYHPKGSLFNYLKYNTLDMQRLLHYSLCLSCGVKHLHRVIQGKPSIAHRDLKSQNILLKLDGTCCIADFGCALTEDNFLNRPKICYKVGTMRYMAPEIFGESVDTKNFESFLKIDIYALGLVFWELCRRTVSSNKLVDNFNLPYEDTVPDIANEKRMREALCIWKVRPFMSARWKNEHIMNEIMKVAEKCWEQNPDDRPSIIDVVDMLDMLTQEIYLSDQDLTGLTTDRQ